jgi:PKHD-type hydroxylase
MSDRTNTAFQSIWYFTDLPDEIIGIMAKELVQNFDKNTDSSPVFTKSEDHQDVVVGFDKVRNSKHTWVSSSHWIGGFLWHYVERANRENFLYDLKCLDNETIQYTIYDEGDYYEWHSDGGLTTHYKPQFISNSADGIGGDFVNQKKELVRKLSFSLQLSNPDDYEGGELELINEVGESYLAPTTQGCLILFDSRTRHRVRKVTKGTRKSLVGWVLGPRWK